MLPVEEIANAIIKNRAEFAQLFTELNRLEKEKQNELRMANNEIKRFKARYSKSNFTTDSAEAADVKMYETHNPGFCFKRNGEHKGQQVTEKTPSVDFEHLHFLLFTNGEVDIEKLLCLHLLSSHETDHLTPPRRPRNISNITKKDSPLEQLIERSNENLNEPPLQNVLPTYILDVSKGNPKRNLIDQRLSARLLVNEKILELILTVVSALENSNPEKVQQLISIAEDTSSLKRIFRQQHIQDFVMTLKDHSLVNSCSSFILTQPLKCKPSHLEIRTPGGALEDLVRYIRSNVLQFPKRENWIMLESESKEVCTAVHTPQLSKSSVTSATSQKRPSAVLKKNESKNASVDEGWKYRRKGVNHIQRNIENIPNFYRSFDEEEEENPKNRKRSSSVTRREKSEGDTKNKRKASFNNSRKSSTASSPREHSEIKVHLKQTKCPACMQKWKIPLPEPKVPKLNTKIDVYTTINETVRENDRLLKTDSYRRIQNLIEQEQYKLSSYDRKYSNASTTSNQSKKRKSSVDSRCLDLVALNVLDLEKIRHEIREKETKKKLENFLLT